MICSTQYIDYLRVLLKVSDYSYMRYEQHIQFSYYNGFTKATNTMEKGMKSMLFHIKVNKMPNLDFIGNLNKIT